MKKIIILFLFISSIATAFTQDVTKHPDTKATGWEQLFSSDLSNAIFPDGVWTVADGVITASKDEALWSKKAYDDFMLDLEFKNAEGTNSGIILHATDLKEWIPHSVEI